MRDLRAWQERLERLSVSRTDSWTPPIDVYETDDRYVVAAELPGLTREDIDVQVENNTLTIKGQRRQDSDVKKENYHRVERCYGAFSRSFSLPNTIDSTKVRAEYHDGVLTVTLPMREESKPRQIQVAVQG